MAKTRAQRKAEQRRRAAQQGGASDGQSRAQHQTQVPESADVTQAKLAEAGATPPDNQATDVVDVVAAAEAAEAAPPAEAEPPAPAPSRADVGRPEPAVVEEEPGDRISRRARKREDRERRERAKASERRRAPREAPTERKRGAVIGFFISCWAELKKVQWPDRETLVQASAVTVLFIAVAAAYLGALDALFNFLVQHLL
jgi:preprotein translocase SecE subunit